MFDNPDYDPAGEWAAAQEHMKRGADTKARIENGYKPDTTPAYLECSCGAVFDLNGQKFICICNDLCANCDRIVGPINPDVFH